MNILKHLLNMYFDFVSYIVTQVVGSIRVSKCFEHNSWILKILWRISEDGPSFKVGVTIVGGV
jgi:hypothetical protein